MQLTWFRPRLKDRVKPDWDAAVRETVMMMMMEVMKRVSILYK